MAKVLCILTDNFEDLEAIGPIAILRRAKIDVDVATLYKTCATGKYLNHLTNLMDLSKINYKDYDLLFLPGGPQWVVLENDPLVKEVIKYYHDNNKYIAAICAMPTVLGKMGYLKDKNYTCFKSMNEDFGGSFHDVYCIKDDKLITGMSAAAAIDFAFLILETLTDKTYAQKIKDSIYYKN